MGVASVLLFLPFENYIGIISSIFMQEYVCVFHSLSVTWQSSEDKNEMPADEMLTDLEEELHL